LTGIESKICQAFTARTRASSSAGQRSNSTVGRKKAIRYQNQIYIKIPKTLSNGEFSLDHDCLPLEEANARIEKWNTEQPF
jgi:hypothetical protein